MNLDAIQLLLTPPATPLEIPASRAEWHLIETNLATDLPPDYKDFISRYGTGCIDKFLWVLNPFSNNKNLNLINQLKPTLDGLASLKKDGLAVPYALFPEKHGLLPWAITDNGDIFYWRCENSPIQWRIVCHDGRVVDWQEFDLTATGFLINTLSRQLVLDIFPEDFPSSAPEFVPSGRETH